MAFTQDWFSHNIPSWQRTFAPLAGKPDLRVLEIGSFEGRSACWLLANVLTGEGARIDCIDTFAGSMEHAGTGIPKMPLLAIFEENVAPWSDRVMTHVGESGAILPALAGLFDVIYVDGSHTAKDVLTDGVLCWRLLKDDGILIFDDYQWQQYPQPELNPKLGIDAFLHAHMGWFDLIELGYQVTVKKRSAYRDPRLPAATNASATLPATTSPA
jgi:predicted O-methyltransferase YrrM